MSWFSILQIFCMFDLIQSFLLFSLLMLRMFHFLFVGASTTWPLNPFDMTHIVFQYDRTFQSCLLYLLTQTQNQIFLQRSLISLAVNRNCILDTRVFIAIGLVSVSRPFLEKCQELFFLRHVHPEFMPKLSVQSLQFKPARFLHNFIDPTSIMFYFPSQKSHYPVIPTVTFSRNTSTYNNLRITVTTVLKTFSDFLGFFWQFLLRYILPKIHNQITVF